MSEDEDFEKLSKQRSEGRGGGTGGKSKQAFDSQFFDDERVSDEEIEVEISEEESHKIRFKIFFFNAQEVQK
jgi:hypothetical protein